METRSDGQRRAVLVFADPVRLDLARRRWPLAFGKLLGMPFLQDARRSDIDVHLFTSAPLVAGRETAGYDGIHVQRAGTFKARLSNASRTLQELGYRQVVIVGRDCPELEFADIEVAFRALSARRMVLGPDHRGGLYLIGLDGSDCGLLEQISWQVNSDCAQLLQLVGHEHVLLLSSKQDLDRVGDLILLARQRRFWFEVIRLLLPLLIGTPCSHASLPWRKIRDYSERISWQLPPPAAWVV